MLHSGGPKAFRGVMKATARHQAETIEQARIHLAVNDFKVLQLLDEDTHS